MNGQVVDLNTMIPANSGWQLTIAIAINDRGQIIGEGTFNNLPRSFLLTPVPWPANGSPASTSSGPISAETPSPAAVPSTVTRVIIQRRTVQLITQPQ